MPRASPGLNIFGGAFYLPPMSPWQQLQLGFHPHCALKLLYTSTHNKFKTPAHIPMSEAEKGP